MKKKMNLNNKIYLCIWLKFKSVYNVTYVSINKTLSKVYTKTNCFWLYLANCYFFTFYLSVFELYLEAAHAMKFD